jgi:hypothetical protein
MFSGLFEHSRGGGLLTPKLARGANVAEVVARIAASKQRGDGGRRFLPRRGH